MSIVGITEDEIQKLPVSQLSILLVKPPDYYTCKYTQLLTMKYIIIILSHHYLMFYVNGTSVLNK